MKKRVLVLCTICFLIGCSKDESTNTQSPGSATLSASSNSVQVGSGETQNVVISGGTPTYTIATLPNSSLASTRLDNANRDTTTLVITGAVGSATGTTPVVIRDNSATAKQISVSITKR